MSRVYSWLLLAAVILSVSCVTAPTAGGGGNLLTVNGKGITAADLLGNATIRNSLKQMLMTETLLAEASKRNLKVEDQAMQDEFKRIEDMAEQSGRSVEEMMSEQGITKEEYLDNIRVSKLFELLVDSESTITDADIQAAWDENAEQMKQYHASELSLADSERDALTFVECKPTIEKFLKNQNRNENSQAMMQLLIDNTMLELTSITDPQQRELLENMIINNSKTKKPAEKPEGAANEGEAEAPAGNAGTANEGGAAPAASGEAAGAGENGDTGGEG